MMEEKTDDKIINHVRNVKLLQAIYAGKKFFVECYPTEKDAKQFPNSNFAVKEIQLPDFDLFEETLGYKWMNDDILKSVIMAALFEGEVIGEMKDAGQRNIARSEYINSIIYKK